MKSAGEWVEKTARIEKRDELTEMEREERERDEAEERTSNEGSRVDRKRREICKNRTGIGETRDTRAYKGRGEHTQRK